MTHDLEIQYRENHPTIRTIVSLDITGLDGAGVEQFDPETEETAVSSGPVLRQTTELTVTPVEWEDETLQIMWDSVDDELKVKNLSDGSDVASGTAVGEVVLEVTGDS
jgi:hypothetical protein